uniref:Secreted protein n=1 Tax=Romanomermis culicivorax TaxID=13658 RepID=A0A915IP10_ROMCU
MFAVVVTTRLALSITLHTLEFSLTSATATVERPQCFEQEVINTVVGGASRQLDDQNRAKLQLAKSHLTLDGILPPHVMKILALITLSRKPVEEMTIRAGFTKVV